MPDMNTLKITYLSENPLKTADFFLIAICVFLVIYLIFYTIKYFVKKEEYSDDSIVYSLGVFFLSSMAFLYFFFGFTAPYADVCVRVVPNLDIREFDMNHSRDFIKKGDDYYFVKTIEISSFEEFCLEQDKEGLSDIIRWNIENSVSGTREEDK